MLRHHLQQFIITEVLVRDVLFVRRLLRADDVQGPQCCLAQQSF